MRTIQGRFSQFRSQILLRQAGQGYQGFDVQVACSLLLRHAAAAIGCAGAGQCGHRGRRKPGFGIEFGQARGFLAGRCVFARHTQQLGAGGIAVISGGNFGGY